MDFYRLNLEVKLDQDKVTEQKFYKIVDKFFNKLSKFMRVKSSEEKLAFIIAERKIIIDISIVIEEKSFLKLQNNSTRLKEVLKYISKFVQYDDCEKVGALYISTKDLTTDLFAYQNTIYLSTVLNEDHRHTQEVINLDGGMVSFVIDEEIVEIPVDTNVVLAHMTFK
ncbi:hypothetical protein EXW39_28570 (plasmid) [Bacillus mycoides]|uniref:Uncharacterized protein n=3 Tax=Bacillus cereus group TaxID=86661 RepID=J9BJQ5_BACCE|nr:MULTISPECIES: hypothetical protein [Bacillus cereus group]EEL67493.1 hypothetical protein bcere0026_56340 [Bacillus mycoides]EJV74225.1 hypothetical protein IG3_05816 [Bacillus cereus HuA2-1]EOO70472.1 hypothetical protein IIC_04602 [Bacillus cereus VD021]QWH64053.1 hypothetical protein EXW39_28570 [Bacillus mycoides]